MGWVLFFLWVEKVSNVNDTFFSIVSSNKGSSKNVGAVSVC